MTPTTTPLDSVPASNRPGRPKSAEKSAAIRRAAGKLFLSEGFERTSMDAVASAAGVSKNTVYSHFASKEALFGAVIAHEVERAGALFGQRVPASLPLATALRLLAGAYQRIVLEDKAVSIFRTVIGESIAHPDVARLFADSAARMTQRVFETFIAERTVTGELAVATRRHRRRRLAAADAAARGAAHARPDEPRTADRGRARSAARAGRRRVRAPLRNATQPQDRTDMTDLRPVLAAAASLLLGACSVLPFSSDTDAPAAASNAAPLDPVHAFLATAPDGAARAIMDPQTGAVTEVTAGDRYFAASGRECRRYLALRRPAAPQAMLACQSSDGRWESRPSLLGGSPSAAVPTAADGNG